ncbi:amino acid ABC transporter substrate-binding protein [Streptococcus chenjunshii]|uniref:Amino acid ABC transporter substrate-binding protein n=1 Tax=Streptococcus chenjunshii TaxID=2173853 RepID=A0A372KN40_9STRE|nr:transporter substrate-binding domain-containing protein [Streptococcus chenjunshii]AXQ78818.1 amino acid ABC transporter substrate-binding protein [Streptococcus chenjunshii]RFU51579.1 amino acid ABC transporter substrate-binding protein [Streptococcus chenjunshii]RFU53699.1 amino acid ABC transporter substrate-binding protein [Streptococcus chenjunshii]
MNKKRWFIVVGVIAAVLLVTFIGRQLSGQANKNQGSTDDLITLQVAHTQSYAPYDFVNDEGESDGFEVAVLKAVDEKLDKYQFEYTPTSDEDLLIGLESGKYDIGTKGAWYTAERAEKFIIPEEPIGASVIGFTIRKEDENTITDIDSFANSKGKLVPISPQNAQYNVIQDYNKTAKNPIGLTEAESFTVADAYAWVLEGRYDAYFDIKLSFEEAVTSEDGAYHQYADRLSWFAYKGIETYPLLHKNEKNKEFAAAYDKAVKELQDDGTLSKLSQKYFGEDVFSYVTD